MAGLNKQNINSSLCPSVWGEFYSRYSHEQLAKIGTGESVGMCHDVQDPSEINVFSGICDYRFKKKAEELGLDIIEVPEAEYAIIELTGPVPVYSSRMEIRNGVFMPEHGYMHSGAPDFEYYYEGDMTSPDYKMELWIPIVKA